MEDWKYNATLNGVSQGGIISPILDNIYLNELSKKFANIKNNFDKPCNERYTADYREARNLTLRLRDKLKRADITEKPRIIDELKLAEKRQKQIPRKPQTDKTACVRPLC